MRLTFFFENYEIGGGSKYVRDCINCAFENQNEVELVSNYGALSPDDFSQLTRPVNLQAVPVFERTQSVARLLGHGHFAALVRKSLIALTPVFFILNIAVIWLRLGRLQSDLVISFNGGYPASEASLAAVIAARLHRLPAILIIMSTPKPRRKLLIGYGWLLDHLVFASVKVVVINSKAQSLMLAQLRGMPLERIRILYNGIHDITRQHMLPPMKKTSIILGVACRLDKMKGLDHLIRAMALLPAWISLHIVGDGEFREELEQLSREQSTAERIIFFGYKQDRDIIHLIDTFDVYVFPSLWEGLPYSLLEAMRAGLPIISTNVGGIPEALDNGRAGLLVAPASPEALANAINFMLNDWELARRLSAAARQRYEELFSFYRMQESFVQIINEFKPNNQIKICTQQKSISSNNK
jgi:glycosyltransferase involved in cell wall biosynthesis